MTILNDFVIEPDETVTLTLSNPVAVGTAATPTLGPRHPATLTITNDDKAGTIEFSAATYTGSETAGPATIVVTRTGGVAEGVTGGLRHQRRHGHGRRRLHRDRHGA